MYKGVYYYVRNRCSTDKCINMQGMDVGQRSVCFPRSVYVQGSRKEIDVVQKSVLICEEIDAEKSVLLQGSTYREVITSCIETNFSVCSCFPVYTCHYNNIHV